MKRFCAAMALAAIAAPGMAQEPRPKPEQAEKEVRLGSRIPVRVEVPAAEDKATVEASATFLKWGRCVVKKDGAAIRARFSAPLAEEGMWPGAQATMSRCLSGLSGARLQGATALFFGVFAQELYRDIFASRPELAAGALKPSSIDNGDPKSNPMLMFADCIVRNAPEAADYIVRADLGSEQESAGFRSASAVFSGCLDAESSIQTKRLTLRLNIANALYRRSMGLVVPPSAP